MKALAVEVLVVKALAIKAFKAIKSWFRDPDPFAFIWYGAGLAIAGHVIFFVLNTIVLWICNWNYWLTHTAYIIGR